VVSDGCAVDQATSTVTVYAAPSAGEDGSINVCLNEPFDLLVGIGGNIDLGGTWYNPSNQALPGSLDTSGTLAGQYNYDYIVTSPVCPSDTSNVMVIVDGSCDYTASLNEIAMQWSLYPNPTSSQLTIVNHTGMQLQDLRVLDLNGKIVLTQNNMASIETELSVTNLNPGVYTVRITLNGQIYNKRFIKQ
jgi:hypothetical protein